MKTPQDYAEFIAVKAIEYMAQNPESLGAFLAHCGLGPRDLKEAITNQDFLVGVLDYLMINEPILIDFSKTLSLDPQDIVKARLCFPGAGEELIG